MSKRTIRLWDRIQCPDCRGVGIQVFEDYYGDGFSDTNYKDCLRCRGSGTITISKETKNASKKETQG